MSMKGHVDEDFLWWSVTLKSPFIRMHPFLVTELLFKAAGVEPRPFPRNAVSGVFGPGGSDGAVGRESVKCDTVAPGSLHPRAIYSCTALRMSKRF